MKENINNNKKYKLNTGLQCFTWEEVYTHIQRDTLTILMIKFTHQNFKRP